MVTINWLMRSSREKEDLGSIPATFRICFSVQWKFTQTKNLKIALAYLGCCVAKINCVGHLGAILPNFRLKLAPAMRLLLALLKEIKD